MSKEAIEAWLDRVIGRRLGYRVGRSPRLLAELETLAKKERRPAFEVLRGIEQRPRGATFERLLHAATVPHTGFFRHPEQLDDFATWLRERPRAAVPEIWCAGCATGEEAWSLALVARRLGRDVRILATDVSAVALRTAEAGRYPARRCLGLGPEERERGWSADRTLRTMVRFARASLVDPDPAPAAGAFDLVFCRNVLLYFEREAAREVLGTIARRLRPAGAVVVAPAETLIPAPPPLAPLGPVGWLGRTEARPASPPEPPPPSTQVEQAARLLASGETDAAEEILHRWLETTPDDARAWFLLGEALLARGEQAQAHTAFARAAGAPAADPLLAAAAARRLAG